jgi:rSAM/selenodomain-associated transferase 1
LSLALIVLARQPSPGRCKRRLAASIGDESAARVQQRLLAHTVAVARQWQQSEADAVVSLCLGHHQGSGGLGLRMQRQLGRAVRAGAKAAVLVGSDLPGLGVQHIQQAFSALHHAPVVLGPACDGGYWLVGLTAAGHQQQRGRLFSGIGWGGSEVLQQTLQQAAALGWSPQLLRYQSDLDRIDDMAPWHGAA